MDFSLLQIVYVLSSITGRFGNISFLGNQEPVSVLTFEL